MFYKVIFFSIFFLIYGAINFYIFIRGWQAISEHTLLRNAYLILFPVISLSYIVGRLLQRAIPPLINDALIWIGSFWFAIMLYLLLSIILIDFLRMLSFPFHHSPSILTLNYEKAKQVTALIVIGIAFIITIAGHINARNIRVTTLTLDIPKRTGSLESLNIVVASDIHLGTIINNSRLEKIVNKINKLNPDIVLLPGDIVDESIAPEIQGDMGVTLLNIRSRYGVFAVTGNHEHIVGASKAVQCIAQCGVTVLRDSVIKIDDSFYLIGREDRSFGQFNGKDRKPLKELMAGIDKSYPIILMDHQPYRLEEASDNGVDLQVSGHTHHGQLFPLNFITRMVYEVSWGYLKKDNTHFYVSCGVGTWGPPVKIGSISEIVNILVNFD